MSEDIKIDEIIEELDKKIEELDKISNNNTISLFKGSLDEKNKVRKNNIIIDIHDIKKTYKLNIKPFFDKIEKQRSYIEDEKNDDTNIRILRISLRAIKNYINDYKNNIDTILEKCNENEDFYDCYTKIQMILINYKLIIDEIDKFNFYYEKKDIDCALTSGSREIECKKLKDTIQSLNSQVAGKNKKKSKKRNTKKTIKKHKKSRKNKYLYHNIII